MSKTETSQLLLEHYLNWQKSEGSSKNIKEFCKTIPGIEYQNFIHYFNGNRQPGKKIATLFAQHFDDARFYQAARVPDPLLDEIIENWSKVPHATRQRISEEVASYSTEQLPSNANHASND
jgi:hypothetical protein